MKTLEAAVDQLAAKSGREEALRLELRRLEESLEELRAEIAKNAELLERSRVGGLREADPELLKHQAELEARAAELEARIDTIRAELREIAEERIEILKEALPEAWRTAREARARAFDPELRERTLERIRKALEPWIKAQREAEEADQRLSALLNATARVNNRAPSIMRQHLATREGPLPSAPSEDRNWRLINRVAGLVGGTK